MKMDWKTKILVVLILFLIAVLSWDCMILAPRHHETISNDLPKYLIAGAQQVPDVTGATIHLDPDFFWAAKLKDEWIQQWYVMDRLLNSEGGRYRVRIYAQRKDSPVLFGTTLTSKMPFDPHRYQAEIFETEGSWTMRILPFLFAISTWIAGCIVILILATSRHLGKSA